jgi:integrase
MAEYPVISSTYLDIPAATAALAPGTKSNHYRGLRNYVAYIHNIEPVAIDLGHLNIELLRPYLTVTAVARYLNVLKSQGKKHAELKNARNSIIMLTRLMVERGFLDIPTLYRLRGLALPRVEMGRHPSIYLNKPQILHLLTVYPQTDQILLPQRTRNWAMICLMLFCGLRVGELLKMQWGDLQHVDGYPLARVHGKYSKLRWVKLPVRVVQSINIWRDIYPNPDPYQFIFTAIRNNVVTNRPLRCKRQIENAVKEAARISHLPPVTPHDLRRSFARNAYLAGTSMELIRQTLGHKSITMSEQYIKAPLELERAATDIWSDIVLLEDLVDDENPAVDVANNASAEIADEPGFTRQQAAVYLGISPARWDRLRKAQGIQPYKTIVATTKPFDVFRQQDIDTLKLQLETRSHEAGSCQ